MSSRYLDREPQTCFGTAQAFQQCPGYAGKLPEWVWVTRKPPRNTLDTTWQKEGRWNGKGRAAAGTRGLSQGGIAAE